MSKAGKAEKAAAKGLGQTSQEWMRLNRQQAGQRWGAITAQGGQVASGVVAVASGGMAAATFEIDASLGGEALSLGGGASDRLEMFNEVGLCQDVYVADTCNTSEMTGTFASAALATVLLGVVAYKSAQATARTAMKKQELNVG